MKNISMDFIGKLVLALPLYLLSSLFVSLMPQALSEKYFRSLCPCLHRKELHGSLVAQW